MKAEELFSSFNDLTVLIIGDVMIDSYLWGTVTRISPEAPVPVVAVTRREDRLGGAANVALNVQSLGAKAILCAVTGKDDKAIIFNSLLKKQKLSNEGIVAVAKRPTTVKTRILGGNHQMMRVDEEIESFLDKKDSERLLATTRKIISSKKPDVIIFEDYDKGCLDPALIAEIISLAKKAGIPTVVDPKKKNFLAYSGCTLFKPNLKELREGLKTDIDTGSVAELAKIVTPFLRKQQTEAALITLSEKGIYVQGKDVREIIPAHLRDITDVSGAGDTVVSVAALCLAAGAKLTDVAKLANLAGGLVCEKAGVVPVDKKQLLAEARRLKL